MNEKGIESLALELSRVRIGEHFGIPVIVDRAVPRNEIWLEGPNGQRVIVRDFAAGGPEQGNGG